MQFPSTSVNVRFYYCVQLSFHLASCSILMNHCIQSTVTSGGLCAGTGVCLLVACYTACTLDALLHCVKICEYIIEALPAYL